MSADEASVNGAYERLKREATESGYFLNPDEAWCLGLVKGLLVNEQRYGYRGCPCRLSVGREDFDRDIVCPCDYRDADVEEFGACYCALYVSEQVASGAKEASPVPERRKALASAPAVKEPPASKGIALWRCRVCGYLCAREQPPGICPICKAKKDRFEAFILPATAIPGA